MTQCQSAPNRSIPLHEDFSDGSYQGDGFRRLHSSLLVVASVALFVIGQKPRGFALEWLMPFLVLMVTWRLTAVDISMQHADSCILEMAMPMSMAPPVRHVIAGLCAALGLIATLSTCFRTGLLMHAALLAVHMALAGQALESTAQHIVLMQLCAATGHAELFEVALSLVHVSCGVQKLNASFFAVFPRFFTSEALRVTGFALPAAAGLLVTWSVPPLEILGGTLVLISAFCRRRHAHLHRVRIGGTVGSVLLLAYHCGVNVLLYGSDDLLVYMYNLACLAVALHALTGHGYKPVFGVLGGTLQPLVFCLAFFLLGLPVANAVYGDSFWGWHPSGSLQLYTFQEPAVTICATSSCLELPAELAQYRVDSEEVLEQYRAKCEDTRAAALCERPPTSLVCFDEGDWAMQTPGQRHYDMSFARAVADSLAVQLSCGRLIVLAALRTRFSLTTRQIVIVCESSCPQDEGHLGGVGIALCVSIAFSYAWHLTGPSCVHKAKSPPPPEQELALALSKTAATTYESVSVRDV